MNVSRFYDKYTMLHVSYISKLEKEWKCKKKKSPPVHVSLGYDLERIMFSVIPSGAIILQ